MVSYRTASHMKRTMVPVDCDAGRDAPTHI
jgi:hypothetical protein